jgi:hypothetical protein
MGSDLSIFMLGQTESMLRLHNRCLTQWVHRIANGVMASLLLAFAGACGTTTLACDSLPWKVSVVLLYASPTGMLASLLNPSKFTLVEGIAGEDGYDELV